MNKYQKFAVIFPACIVILFLIVSIITDNWGFVLWSLFPVLVVGPATYIPAKNHGNVKRGGN